MSDIKKSHLLNSHRVIFLFLSLRTASAIPYSLNSPRESSCVNWNQYYTNCTQLGGKYIRPSFITECKHFLCNFSFTGNPFQGTISFDNIGLAWVAIFLVIIITFWLYISHVGCVENFFLCFLCCCHYLALFSFSCGSFKKESFFFLSLKHAIKRKENEEKLRRERRE